MTAAHPKMVQQVMWNAIVRPVRIGVAEASLDDVTNLVFPSGSITRPQGKTSLGTSPIQNEFAATTLISRLHMR